MSISSIVNQVDSQSVPTLVNQKNEEDKKNETSSTSFIGFVAFVIKLPINLVGMVPGIGISVGIGRITFALLANLTWYLKGVTIDKVMYTEKVRAEIQTDWKKWRQNQCWRGILELIPFIGGSYLLYYDLIKGGTNGNPSFY